MLFYHINSIDYSFKYDISEHIQRIGKLYNLFKHLIYNTCYLEPAFTGRSFVQQYLSSVSAAEFYVFLLTQTVYLIFAPKV